MGSPPTTHSTILGGESFEATRKDFWPDYQCALAWLRHARKTAWKAQISSKLLWIQTAGSKPLWI
jgi:hypothetical protein